MTEYVSGTQIINKPNRLDRKHDSEEAPDAADLSRQEPARLTVSVFANDAQSEFSINVFSSKFRTAELKNVFLVAADSFGCL